MDSKQSQPNLTKSVRKPRKTKLDTIEILGKPYIVHERTEEEMPGLMGQAMRIKQEIWLRKDLPPAQRHETLLHEVLHAIDGELIIGLEEDDVCRLAVALYASGWRHAKG